MQTEEQKPLYEVRIFRGAYSGRLCLKGCKSIPDAINRYLAEKNTCKHLTPWSFGVGDVYEQETDTCIGTIDKNGTFTPRKGVTVTDYGTHATALRHFDTPHDALKSMREFVTDCMEATVERMVKEREHYTADDMCDMADRFHDYRVIKDRIGFIGIDLARGPDQTVVREIDLDEGPISADISELRERTAHVKADQITITLGKKQAESLSDGLSDFLCWAAGFSAALREDEDERDPMGVCAAREVNLHLKRALDKAEGVGT